MQLYKINIKFYFVQVLHVLQGSFPGNLPDAGWGTPINRMYHSHSKYLLSNFIVPSQKHELPFLACLRLARALKVRIPPSLPILNIFCSYHSHLRYNSLSVFSLSLDAGICAVRAYGPYKGNGYVLTPILAVLQYAQHASNQLQIVVCNVWPPLIYSNTEDSIFSLALQVTIVCNTLSSLLL